MDTQPPRIYTCVNSPDLFCYICGLFLPFEKRRIVTDEIRKIYFDYFKIHINQNNHWTPNFICLPCQTNLQHWAKNDGKLLFGAPMIWREPFNHTTDCYFCAVPLRGINWSRRNDPKWYGNVLSVTKTLPHSEFLPVPVPLIAQTIDTAQSPSTSGLQSSGSVFVPSGQR